MDSSTFQKEDSSNLFMSMTQAWTRKVPIGLGLCPWAARSDAKGLLQYVICEETNPSDVALKLVDEARKLIGESDNSNKEETAFWWRTTLLVCPHTSTWQDDFGLFDEFVKTQQQLWKEMEESGNDDIPSLSSNITLVAFHPLFIRWRGLPNGTKEGDILLCRKPKKSYPSLATLLEESTRPFGRRKVKVQFHDDGRKCFVDTKDCSLLPEQATDDNERPILPDNAMHRSPYPTIHLIRNQDLARLSLPDISRVKRKNMQQMTRLAFDRMDGT
jgi:hypothetical protein